MGMVNQVAEVVGVDTAIMAEMTLMANLVARMVIRHPSTTRSLTMATLPALLKRPIRGMMTRVMAQMDRRTMPMAGVNQVS